MIRPASEIEFPPSEALCTKARMIARVEQLSGASESMMAVIAARLNQEEVGEYLREIEQHDQEQKRLIENMKRMIRN